SGRTKVRRSTAGLKPSANPTLATALAGRSDTAYAAPLRNPAERLGTLVRARRTARAKACPPTFILPFSQLSTGWGWSWTHRPGRSGRSGPPADAVFGTGAAGTLLFRLPAGGPLGGAGDRRAATVAIRRRAPRRCEPSALPLCASPDRAA